MVSLNHRGHTNSSNIFASQNNDHRILFTAILNSLMSKRKLGLFLAGIFFLSAIFVTPALAERNGAIETLRQTGKAFTIVAKDTVPAVVSIKVETTVKGSSRTPSADDFYEHFFGPRFRTPQQPDRKKQGQGSGFIISKDGYIMTNNHLVGDADKITVTLTDGREFEAELIGADPKTDVAVIKIEGKKLPIVELGDSDNIQIGEWAIAVGNPFGLDATVTAGVISAKGRQFSLTEDGYGDFIQTDAAINPGNSGGPLLNIDGEAIGINTFIISQSGGYMGIGFAIPINMAKSIKDQLIETGKVTRGYLGVYMSYLTKEMAEYFDLENAKGVLISEVEKGSPAEKAGLKAEDVIITIDEKEVDNPQTLRNYVAFLAPGTKVKLKVIRANKEIEVAVKLGTRPEGGTTDEFARKLGLEVEEISDELAQELDMSIKRGVAISKVKANSDAQAKGLKKGMVILSVNRIRVDSVKEFNKEITEGQESGKAFLYVFDGRNKTFVLLSIDD